MADYTVEYQILVDSGSALSNIKSFQTAVNTLAGLSDKFNLIQENINKINTAFATLKQAPALEMTMDISRAEAGIKSVSAQLEALQAKANIKLKLTNEMLGFGKGRTSFADVVETRINRAYQSFQEKFKGSAKKIEDFNKQSITPIVNIDTAMEKLGILEAKMDAIVAKGKKPITLTVNNPKGSAFSTTPAGNATSSTSTPGAAIIRPSRRGTALYPTTANVLGPTYANTGSSIMGEMVKSMGVAYGIGAAMSGIGQIFKDATSYQNISQTTKNILGTHDLRPEFLSEFEATSKMMRQVGVDTKYTAPQVAEAGKFLAMAGYNVGDINKSIRPITNIALVGDSDLGQTADVLTNIMTSYELDPARMNNAADVLTMTFTKTNTTLMELAESFKYAGTIANQTGLSFEETSAAFGVLGNAGIKGSQAGTTLRMMLLNMLNPTKKQKAAWQEAGVSIDDGLGNFRSLSDILTDLHKVSEKMSAYDFTGLIGRMFRVTAAPGALALINNAERIGEVVDANYSSSGLSSELALAKQNTIEGLWYQFTSAFTESGMKGFEGMQEQVRMFLQSLIKTMKSPEFVSSLSSAMNIFLGLVKSLNDIFGTMMNIWNMIPNFMKNGIVWFAKLQMGVNMLTGGLKMLMGPIQFIKGVAMGSWFSNMFTKPIFGIMTFNKYLKRTHSSMMALTAVARGLGIGGISGGKTAWYNRSLVQHLMKIGPMAAILSGAVASVGAMSMVMRKSIGKQSTLANSIWEFKQKIDNYGFGSLDWSKEDSIMIGNMSIYNDQLLTQNKRIAKATELYQLYYDAKYKAPPKQDKSTPYVDTDEGADVKGIGSFLFNPHSDIITPFNKMLGAANGERVYYSGKPAYNVDSYLFGSYDPHHPENIRPVDFWTLQAYMKGASQKDKLDKIQKEVADIAFGSESYAVMQKNIDLLKKKYILDPEKNMISNQEAFENRNKLTTEEYYSSEGAVVGFASKALPIFEGIQSILDIYQSVDKNGNMKGEDLQKILQFRLGGALFNNKLPLPGSVEWKQAIHNIINEPELLGEGYTTDKVRQLLVDTFTGLLNFYNFVPSNYRYLYAPLLNRTMWESFMNKPGMLPEGGFIAGNKQGDTMTSRGVKYIWDWGNQGGIPQWKDKNGNTFVPSTATGIDFRVGDMTHVDENGNPTISNFGGGSHNDNLGKSTYSTISSAPKQVIVRIENLMNVENVDMTDERKAAVVTNLKEEMAQALLEVVAGFSSDLEG